MLTAQTQVQDSIPVLTLAGRLDSNGAAIFDQSVAGLDAAWCVLDVAAVSYLSSIGIRSLLRNEQKLRELGGGQILLGLSPELAHVLALSELLQHFRQAASLAEAVALASSAIQSAGTQAGRTFGDRRYIVRKLASPCCALETWEEDTRVSLQDLGIACGCGRLGEQDDDPRGMLLSTGFFCGLEPDDPAARPDFLLAPKPSEVHVRIDGGLSLAGDPSLVAELDCPRSFTLRDVVEDVRELAPGQPHLGLVMVALMAGPVPRSALVVLLGREGQDWRAGAATLQGLLPGPLPDDVRESLAGVTRMEHLESVLTAGPDTELSSAKIWIFNPQEIRSGPEKLLKIEFERPIPFRPEWDRLTRAIYTDSSRVVLTPLHGGFSSQTFRVASFDREGRRLLPTVMKIASVELTRREMEASLKYAQKFILNNCSICMGTATYKDWAGLRYNFLGITGPESQLSWLRHHYEQRPVEDVLPLFDRLFTVILKPWYGQPRWEAVQLYQEHDPGRLFSNILGDAAKELGISAEDELMDCPELGYPLPNPYHFLKHEYPRRAAQSRLWYRGITHGDLNMQNILLDERENLYVIDFSETRPRNIVADFARLEPIVALELTRLETAEDMRHLLEFYCGITGVARIDEALPFTYRGSDPFVHKARALITRLRHYSDVVTLFETDLVPYILAVLEWTYSITSYIGISRERKRLAAYAAGLMVRQIQRIESGPGRVAL